MAGCECALRLACMDTCFQVYNFTCTACMCETIQQLSTAGSKGWMGVGLYYVQMWCIQACLSIETHTQTPQCMCHTNFS